MLISGPTQCGKSSLTHELLADPNMFSKPIGKIYWFYGQYCKELYRKPYIVNQGLPESFEDIEPFSVVVLDDLMDATKNHAGVTSLFTRLVHHKNLFVINITQNYYQQSKDARTRRLNTQYLIIFKNPADITQVNTIANQMFPKNSNFLTEAYKYVIQKPHGYLFIDLRQETPDEIRIRTSIIKRDFPMVVFTNKHTMCF